MNWASASNVLANVRAYANIGKRHADVRCGKDVGDTGWSCDKPFWHGSEPCESGWRGRSGLDVELR